MCMCRKGRGVSLTQLVSLFYLLTTSSIYFVCIIHYTRAQIFSSSLRYNLKIEQSLLSFNDKRFFLFLPIKQSSHYVLSSSTHTDFPYRCLDFHCGDFILFICSFQVRQKLWEVKMFEEAFDVCLSVMGWTMPEDKVALIRREKI